MSVPAPNVMKFSHDSQKFSETVSEDPAMDFESEGGWRMSRPRFTRQPPNTYTLGFTDIAESHKQTLQDLYTSLRGSSDIITGWIHPTSGATIDVRFKAGVAPTFTYAGRGGTHRWNVSNFVIEEV